MDNTGNPFQSPVISTAELGSEVEYQHRKQRSLYGFGIAVLPGVVSVLAFYSLALHMFLSLGAWPKSLGERGFSNALVIHAEIAFHLFMCLFFGGLAWPFALLVCGSIPRFHFLVKYLLAFLGSFLLCIFLMQLAPKQFLVWWWD
ncbi:MAG: hypothetical protein AAF483_12135 [Planctomycetota bacterium]